MKARAKITDKRGGLEALRKAIKRFDADKPVVRVGLLADASAKRDGVLTNPELGIIHEFGAPNAGIPARPFLRPAIAKHTPEYLKLLEAVLKRAMTGEMDHMQGLALIGQKASADVKNYVTQGSPIPPPNAPATLARKKSLTRKGSTGSVRTLVDTGRMVGSISYVVEKGTGNK